jgi:hypothetical protein
VSSRRERLVFGVAATFVGVLMFVIASSYIVSRGKPLWLAGAVGGFAFPVAPVLWHLIGERRRRKKKLAEAKTAPKTSLTPGDRYWLRCFTVALLVIGPMIAIGKLDVARAVWRHGLWFIPASYEPSTTHGGPLSTIGSGTPRTIEVIGTPLARVPSDAELVVFVRPPPDETQDGFGVLAWGDGQLLAAGEGDDLKVDKNPEEAIAELNKQRGKVPWLPTEPVALVINTGKTLVFASEGWRGRVDPPGLGPSTDILRELGRAPKDAFFVAGFVPKTTRDVLSTKAGAAWLSKQGESLVVEGRIEAVDEAAAKKLVAEATRALRDAASDVPQSCREQVGKIIESIKLDQTGAVVTGRVEVKADAMMGVMFCALKD